MIYCKLQTEATNISTQSAARYTYIMIYVYLFICVHAEVVGSRN